MKCISSLLSLDISNNQITAKIELEIANAICSNSYINKLCFSNCFIKDGCFHVIKAIQNTVALKTLHMNSIFISDDQDELLSKGFSLNTTLEYLDISNCSLEETRLLSLLASLQNTIFLQHLSLNSTKITTQLAEAVAGILCNSYKYMNYLSLQKCELSAYQIKIIAKVLKKCQVLSIWI